MCHKSVKAASRRYPFHVIKDYNIYFSLTNDSLNSIMYHLDTPVDVPENIFVLSLSLEKTQNRTE